MKTGNALTIANCTFEDRVSGLGKRIVSVAGALRAQQITTLVFLPDRGGNLHLALADAGIARQTIRQTRIPTLKSIPALIRWLAWLPRDIATFAVAFRRSRVDIVHVNGAFYLAAAVAAKLARKPLVWHFNDTIIPRPLCSFFATLACWMADRVVVAAQAVAHHYGLKPCQVTVLYAPVDPSLFQAASENVAPTTNIAFIGNWGRVKGIDYLFEAFAGVCRAGKCPVRLHIAGARLQSQRNYCDARMAQMKSSGIEAQVMIHGFVNDIPAFLAGKQMLVLTSLSEACPISVLEAMAAGIPVIAFDVGGVSEILEPHGEKPCGIVVAPLDSGAICQAILSLIDDPERARTLGRHGRKRVCDHFSLAACADAHATVYREVAR